MHAAGKMKRSPSPPVVERPGGAPLAPADGRKGAAGLVWAVEGAEPRVGQNRVKKQLRMSAARRLCSGHRSERPAWLHHYARDLLTPARCAELPPVAREAGQHWPWRRSFPSKSAPLAGSDDAEARRAASGRSGGFAQSCGRDRCFDRGRPDLCSRHQQGSCGRFARGWDAVPAVRVRGLAQQNEQNAGRSCRFVR